jgi:hypothetical protein
MKGFLGLLILLATGSITTVRCSDEENVPLDKLPKAVSNSIMKRFPKAELVKASKETEDGKTEYEVMIKDGGKKIDVTTTTDGVIVGLEKEIAMKDLPKAILETLEGKYAKASFKTVEEIIKIKDGKENLEGYELHLVTADQKSVEVTLTRDGKIKKTEEKKEEKK